MSDIADILDIVDRSTERTLKRRELLTPSIRAQLAKQREAALAKASAERTAQRSASRYKANMPDWMDHLRFLRFNLSEIKGRKRHDH